jgi:hypothetical protein
MDHDQGRKEKAALDAARRGWPVIPLQWSVHGRCSCGNPKCTSVGKHPLTEHGIRDATLKKATICSWWGRWPKANVGIATGVPSGIVVLDSDPRHGGSESLSTLEDKYGPLPDGPRVRTGGGGEHAYFLCPPGGLNNKVGLLPGIDIRGDGGYVVGPGSTHFSGGRYLWRSGMTPSKIHTPPLPDRLLKLILERRDPTKPESSPLIPEGRRHTTLVSFAGTMRTRGMSSQAIEVALIEENYARCTPHLPDHEVRQIAASVNRYASRDEQSGSSLIDNEKSEERKLPFRSATTFATETSADVPWIAKPWVAIGSITGLHGKPKDSGKTTFAMHAVRQILDGQAFMQQPTCKTAAVYLSEERPATLIQALRKANLLGRDDLILLLSHETRGYSWPDLVQAAIEECKSQNAKLLVVDTFAQFAGFAHAEENSAGDVLTAIKPLMEAAATGLAVVVVHHERKSGGLVSDSGRGSSAIAGAADIVISLRRPEGNQNRAVRVIHAISRFSETPSELQIELTEHGYCALGTPGEVVREQATSDLLEMIPPSKKKAVTIEALMERTRKARPYVQKHLDALLGQAKILRTGKGRKKDPYRFYMS